MNAEELKELTKQRVREVKRKGIWQRAYKIVEAFGKKKREQSSDHTTISYDLLIETENGTISIHKCNYVYGGDYIYINGRNGQVFNASETDKFDLERRPQEAELSFSYKGKDGKEEWIRVDGYIPGDWEKLLNFRFVKKTIEALEKKRREKITQASEEERRRIPLDEKERAQARAFGLT